MKINYLNNKESKNILIQCIDDHDESLLEKEIELIKRYSTSDFCLITIKVDDWFNDLTPWKMKPIFGKQAFGDGASNLIKFIKENILLNYDSSYSIYIGGYSLAGLFALYSSYYLDNIKGVAACSPSLWFKDFKEFAFNNETKTNLIYLSLGDKEELSKNKIMKEIGSLIKEFNSYYLSINKECYLEMNKGNHFVDNEIRIAKGFAYLLNKK